jgi:hypothetical protein
MAITGVATTIGGMLHTFPFLISNLPIALDVAYTGIRAAGHRLHSIPAHEGKSSCNDLQVIVGGGLVFALGLLLGKIGAA